MSTQQKQQEEGMTAPTIAAWAIKAPDGHLMFDSLNEDVPYLADCERDEGYRCVKVHITEAQE